MDSNKSVANKYIEEAEKLRESSVKYIIGLTLIIFFCWQFTETVFSNTKFDAVRLNRLEEKIKPYTDLSGKLSEGQQVDYVRLKLKLEHRDSVNIQAYKAIEENIPAAFKILLKFATQRPFGICLTSLTILSVLFYLFNLRRSYLNKITIALRIIKDEGGFNKIYDYNFLTPFWVFPVPQTSDNGITRDDLITLGGAKKLSKFYFFLILATVVIFFSIQIRLFYISLIINSYKLHWVLVIQSIIVLFSTYIVAIWFLPSSLQDTYKHEPKFNSYSRRNFITSIVSLLCGVILGGFSKSISHSITNDILEPRFRSLKQKFKKTSICRQLELKALKEIREGNLVKASEEIYSEISRKENVANLNQFTRVFDLIIVLCYKDKAIYDQKFEKVISLAKTGNGRLRDKCKTWKNASKESIERKSKRKYWDKNEI